MHMAAWLGFLIVLCCKLILFEFQIIQTFVDELAVPRTLPEFLFLKKRVKSAYLVHLNNDKNAVMLKHLTSASFQSQFYGKIIKISSICHRLNLPREC